MKNLTPVYLKEMRSYFSSPIAYLAITMFLLIASIFFILIVKQYSAVSFEVIRSNFQLKIDQLNIGEGMLAHLYSNIAVIVLFMMPALTMKSFSDEKKTGTIELMFTYPIKDSELVWGKQLAIFTVYAVMIACTLPYELIILYFKPLPLGIVFSGYLGLLLLGFAFISLGLFVSSLTENQIIAAVGTFGALMMFWVIGLVAGDSTMPIAEILRYLSIFSHFESFAMGVIDTRDIVYYLSFSLLFIFGTLRVLESRRYRA